MLYSPSKGQFHPMTFDRDNSKITVIPQELINFIVDTNKNKYDAHPDKRGGLSAVLSSPVVVATVTIMVFVMGIVGFIIYWQEIATPMLHEGQIQQGVTQKTIQVMEQYNERLDLLLGNTEKASGTVLIPNQPPNEQT